MGKFKKFLSENEDILQQIYAILDDLSDEELDEFGAVLYSEFLDSDEEIDDDETFDLEDVKDMIQELSYDSYDDILDLLDVEEFECAGYDQDGYEETSGDEYKNRPEVYEGKDGGEGDKAAYQEFLKKAIAKFGGSGTDISTVPEDKRDELGDYIDKNWVSDDEEAGIDEARTRKLKVKNRNKKKRKFQKKTVSQLRRGKSQRKVQARKDKPKKKRIYRANKKKIQSYQKSRGKAIKSGKHIARVRRR